MPRLLLLLPTTSYRIRDFLQSAQRAGADVVVASEKPNTMGGKHPDALLSLDFRDPRAAAMAVQRFHRRLPIDAVIPVDDETAVVAAAIGEFLGLPCNSVDSAIAAGNKRRLAELMQRNGLPAPLSRVFGTHEDPLVVAGSIQFPCVLKPTFLSGSRGVIRADDQGSFVDAWERLCRILCRPEVRARGGPEANVIMAQDFVSGPEVALEGLLTEGILRVLALFDKPDPLEGPYFEETIYVTPSRHPLQLQIEISASVERAARAIGLVEGPVHAELRLPARGPVLIELAARSIGGLCSRTLRFGTGLSLEDITLCHALGLPWEKHEREQAATGVMMIPVPAPGTLEEVRGHEAARATPAIEEVTITVPLGGKLVPLPEGSSYLGFIFARGARPEEVEEALRTAHSHLEFTVR